MSRSSRTVYVGNLPGDVRHTEIKDIFYKYGKIVDIDLKLPPRPPGYCFIEFDDARDAEDAIRGRDGYSFDGYHLRVELAHSGRRSSDRYGGGSGGRSSSSMGSRGVSRRTEFRVVVTNLPSSASWQDLKDHMRTAGEVCFAEVFREPSGTRGVVDFTNHEDMKNAIRKLDDTEFRNPFARSQIRVKEEKGSSKHSLSRSPSRSRSRSRGRSRSPVRSRKFSRSRRRSRSPVRRSRSPAAARPRSVSPRSPSPAKGRSSRSPSRSVSPMVRAVADGKLNNGSAPNSPKIEEADARRSSPARSPSPGF